MTERCLRTLARWVAYAIFLVYASYQFCAGFVEGVLEVARRPQPEQEQEPEPAQRPRIETPFPSRSRPRQQTRSYEILCDQDSEVTVNGIPIGHIDASPWQFCSYDAEYGNGPARPSKARAFDDACDYAESVVRHA